MPIVVKKKNDLWSLLPPLAVCCDCSMWLWHEAYVVIEATTIYGVSLMRGVCPQGAEPGVFSV